MTQPHVACRTLPGARFFASFLASPGLMAADNRAAKSTNDAEETITVVADGAQQSATSGYQPLSSATATLTSMPLLDIPRWSTPSAIGFSKISTPPHSMRRCITSPTWCRPTPSAVPGRLYPPRLRRQPRRLDHDQRPAHRAAAQL